MSLLDLYQDAPVVSLEPVGINPELLRLASARLKVAFGEQAPGGMPQGAPPQGAPPQGAPPQGDPSMMGGAQPGMPPQVDPMAAAGAMGGGAPAMPQPMGGTPGAPAVPQKVKPEQMMQMLDFRLYNMQQQLTAIMNALKIQLPPDALVLPPGSTVAPPAEAALPGGPMDTGNAQQGGGDPAAAGGGGAPTDSAIQPIEAMQGAQPQPKAASWVDAVLNPEVDTTWGEPDGIPDPLIASSQRTTLGAEALAAIYRSATRAA